MAGSFIHCIFTHRPCVRNGAMQCIDTLPMYCMVYKINAFWNLNINEYEYSIFIIDFYMIPYGNIYPNDWTHPISHDTFHGLYNIFMSILSVAVFCYYPFLSINYYVKLIVILLEHNTMDKYLFLSIHIFTLKQMFLTINKPSWSTKPVRPFMGAFIAVFESHVFFSRLIYYFCKVTRGYQQVNC